MNKSWCQELPYYSREELACKHCGEIKLDLVFAAALVSLRVQWDSPLRPTSICRCTEHNEAVGGHVNSLHLTENSVRISGGASAADISWVNWPSDIKLRFARMAWAMGFSLGLNKSFVHIDARAMVRTIGLPQHIFHYENWTFAIKDRDIKS